MLTVRGQHHTFSTHKILSKCQSFWDRKCLITVPHCSMLIFSAIKVDSAFSVVPISRKDVVISSTHSVKCWPRHFNVSYVVPKTCGPLVHWVCAIGDRHFMMATWGPINGTNGQLTIPATKSTRMKCKIRGTLLPKRTCGRSCKSKIRLGTDFCHDQVLESSEIFLVEFQRYQLKFQIKSSTIHWKMRRKVKI